MKVFNISPHLSGTRSFASFCGAHGLRVAHWCGPEEEARVQARLGELGDHQLDFALQTCLWSEFAAYFEAADVFADFPTPLIYPVPLDLRQDAKFVLVRRDTGAWIKSVRRHIGGKPMTFLEWLFYTHITGRSAISIDDYTDQLLADAYEEYMLMIDIDFAFSRQKLLVVNLGDGDIGERIAAFLNFEKKFGYPWEGCSQ
jgi:hypothetical protein